MIYFDKALCDIMTHIPVFHKSHDFESGCRISFEAESWRIWLFFDSFFEQFMNCHWGVEFKRLLRLFFIVKIAHENVSSKDHEFTRTRVNVIFGLSYLSLKYKLKRLNALKSYSKKVHKHPNEKVYLMFSIICLIRFISLNI